MALVAVTLHTFRTDESPLLYNQADTYMPDLLICRRDGSDQMLKIIVTLGARLDGAILPDRGENG